MPRSARDQRRTAGRWAALWGIGGVAGLFAVAVWRLGRRGIETIAAGLGAAEWTALVTLTALFVAGEGVAALDRRWVPAFLERTLSLRTDRRRLPRLLAPLHGLSLVGVPAPHLVRAWTGTAAIVAAVFLVRSLPEPWRGIVDFAVAAALLWGLIAIVRRLPAVWRDGVDPARGENLPLETESAGAGTGSAAGEVGIRSATGAPSEPIPSRPPRSETPPTR